MELPGRNELTVWPGQPKIPGLSVMSGMPGMPGMLEMPGMPGMPGLAGLPGIPGLYEQPFNLFRQLFLIARSGETTQCRVYPQSSELEVSIEP